MTGYLTRVEFRALLDLFMASDPWPLDDAANETVERLLDRTAQTLNYPTWVEAFHSKEIP